MQNKLRHRIDSSRGFSLVEVLVVISIIVVLSVVAWLAIGGRVKGAAKRTVVISDMRQIVVALNVYRSDNDDGLPSNWKSIGYIAVNKKGKFGNGFPPRDVYYDNPPKYDVSYHTPECAAPPAASPAVFVWRQNVEAFRSKARANQLDIERTPAVEFIPGCLPGSGGTHPFSYLVDNKITTIPYNHHKSLSFDLSGSLSYQWYPDWFAELALVH